jgi:hypothetical protein
LAGGAIRRCSKHVLTVLYPTGAAHLLAYACLELHGFDHHYLDSSKELDIVVHLVPGAIAIQSAHLTGWQDPRGLGVLALLPEVMTELPLVKITVVGLEGLPRCILPLSASVGWDMEPLGEEMFERIEGAMHTATRGLGQRSEGRVRCVTVGKYRASVGEEQYALETVPPLGS